MLLEAAPRTAQMSVELDDIMLTFATVLLRAGRTDDAVACLDELSGRADRLEAPVRAAVDVLQARLREEA